MNTKPRIERPDDPTLNALCDELTELAPSLESEEAWPAQQLELCGRYGVFEWFISREQGGQGWNVRTCWNRFNGVIYATSPELP